MDSTERPQWQWRAVGQTVQGASHVRSGLPNQDALCWDPPAGGGPPLILAVSDGHGSAKYFRSDVGARLAVEITVQLLAELLHGQPAPDNLTAVKRLAEERLPQELVRRWREAVKTHLGEMPFTPAELETLAQKDGPRARQAVEKDPFLAYGATIVATLVTDGYILYLQLGDGDILVVSDAGEVSRPLERDARLFANQTTSLCQENVWRDVQLRFQALVEPPPALVLLSTDGYANSFINEEAFLKVGSDLLEMIRADGLEMVAANLAGWLTEASQSGSGDDVTLAVLCRTDIAPSRELVRQAEQLPASVAPPETPPEEIIDPAQEYPWMDPTPVKLPHVKK